MESFGHFIRTKREDLGMPLRKLAALLDIDQSTLSKIERNEREPNKEMLPLLAKAFKMNDKEVSVKFWGEKISYELKDEPYGLDALKVAEKQMKYYKTNKKTAQ